MKTPLTRIEEGLKVLGSCDFDMEQLAAFESAMAALTVLRDAEINVDSHADQLDKRLDLAIRQISDGLAALGCEDDQGHFKPGECPAEGWLGFTLLNSARATIEQARAQSCLVGLQRAGITLDFPCEDPRARHNL